MKQGGLVGPRHPVEEGLGHPELKGHQQLEDWPNEVRGTTGGFKAG